MTDTNLGNVGGDVALNQGRDMLQAGEDVVGRDKTINIINNYQKTDEKTPTEIFIPRLMPYLPNRVNQELSLGRKIKQHNDLKRPFVCIIHGEENECCDIFVERIIFDTLNKIIPNQCGQGIKSYQFSCDKFKSCDELHLKIQASLGEQVMNNMFAELESISETFAQQKCPIILSVTLSSGDCLNRQGIKNIEFFFDFWGKWILNKQQNNLLLVCLSFTYKPINSGFFKNLFSKNSLNSTIRHYFKNLDFSKFNLEGVVLPELETIEQDQVEDWARIHLNSIHEKLQPKIRQIFAKNKQQTISMETLADQLREMLQEFNH